MTQNPAFNPEDQWQAARAAAGPTPQAANGPSPQPTAGPPPQYAAGAVPQSSGGPAPHPGATADEAAGKSAGRPSNVVLAGAGSLLAVLAFLGGMAVGHSWDGTSNQQNQFGGPGGGGFGQFPGQGSGQGAVPGQGTQPGTGTQSGSTQTS